MASIFRAVKYEDQFLLENSDEYKKQLTLFHNKKNKENLLKDII